MSGIAAETPGEGRTFNRNLYAWAALIALLTFVLFSPSLGYKFLTFDDDQYVYQNPMLVNGVSIDGVVDAWTQPYARYYTPVLWMSYMIDRAVFGLEPFGFHLTNVTLHAVNAGMVFLLLWYMTGSLIPALAGAALFAWHPLRLESVAWITERKDVLSLFWGLLATFAYLRYARLPSTRRMLGVLALLLAGLLSKPSVIVLPALFILMDYWPLGRGTLGLARLISEKVLLWVGAIAITGLTLATQSSVLVPVSETPLLERIFHVPVIYMFYLMKTVWPAGLTAFYPALGLPWMTLLASGFAFVMLTTVCLTRPRQTPALAMGFAWFIIALLPVSGLIRSGVVQLADRFMYIPAIGLSIMFAWAMDATMKKYRNAGFSIVYYVIPAAFAVVTLVEQPRWKDSLSLYRSAIDRMPHPAAHYNLGTLYALLNEPEAAVDQFEAAAALAPERPFIYYNLGNTLMQLGRSFEAIAAYRRTLELDPTKIEAWGNLANIEFVSGNHAGALNGYREAMELEPDNPMYINNAAWILATTPDTEIRNVGEGLMLARKAVEMAPDQPSFHDTLAAALAESGDFTGALEHIDIAIEMYQSAGAKSKVGPLVRRQAAYRENRTGLKEPSGK